MATTPPSIRRTLPSTNASATFRRPDSTMRPKVGLETFILAAASSW